MRELMVWISGHQGTLAPALVALFRQADARWPNRSRASDGTIGDTAHASRVSDHNPQPPNPPGWVDAADLTEDHDNGPDLPALWNDLIARHDPRVKYLIYEGRIVKSYRDAALRPAWVPQPYTGINAHKQHLHISVTAAGRMDTSPWWPAVVPAPKPPVVAPPQSEEDEMIVIYRDRNGGHYLHAPTGRVFYALSKMGEVEWWIANGAKLVEVEDQTILNAAAACA